MEYRPPIGIPLRSKKKDWRGIAVSVVIHAVILLIIIGPLRSVDFSNIETPQGAGGSGPVGGGGGGAKGIEEHINYISTSPAATVPKLPEPVITPPVIPPLQPKPVVTPTVPQPSANNTSANSQSGVSNGSGLGSGAGPGSGGGVGSGIGTGKGTGNGPGTGGGNATSYPPTPVQFFLPPLPAPSKIKPYRLIAWFEVDEKGNSKLLDFNPSKDKDYNRRLRDVLNALKFRPGVDVNGKPVKDTVNVEYLFD